MDGAESSSDSEKEVDDQSEEEMNSKVHLFFKQAYKNDPMKNLFPRL